ncbi:MAG: PQQ-binding-like beta-propeller repeat protein [Pseudomonadota bacterium]
MAALLMVALTGCDTVGDFFEDDEKPPLPGERLSVLQLERQLEPDPELSQLQISVPSSFTNREWPQAGGYPDHNMGHLSLGTALEPIWRADIGSGSSRAVRLVAQPIVAEGRVYTLDTDAELRAFDLSNGRELWSVETRLDDEDDDVLTGGIGLAEGRIFVTTGYATLVAFEAETGNELWRQRLSAPSRAAPTIAQGRVFVITVDNRLIAHDAATGTVAWDHGGLIEAAGLLGGASPATDGTVVVSGYSSGEIHGLRIENGTSVWQDSVAPVRRLGMMASLADIEAMPVIADGVVYTIGHAQRFLAIDIRNGTRRWQRRLGSTATPVVAGDFLFVISNDNELVALTRQDGRIRWVTPLPQYEDEEDREDPIVWTSPILAGGRLLIAGSDETVLEIDPTNGQPLTEWESRDAVIIDPVIVDNTLLLLDEGGTLTAYR